MKKLFALAMAAAMLLSLTGCAQPAPEPEQPAGAPAVEIGSALELLENVWAGYADNEKFSAAGGDANEENMTMDAPGKFGIEDAAALDSMLALPADAAAMIDDAASLMHMMNANTFTCGAFRAAEGEEAAAIAAALEENIKNRQWICGFPERMLIMTIGDYVVSAFGAADLIEVFKGHALEAYEGMEVVLEEAIA